MCTHVPRTNTVVGNKAQGQDHEHPPWWLGSPHGLGLYRRQEPQPLPVVAVPTVAHKHPCGVITGLAMQSCITPWVFQTRGGPRGGRGVLW